MAKLEAFIIVQKSMSFTQPLEKEEKTLVFFMNDFTFSNELRILIFFNIFLNRIG